MNHVKQIRATYARQEDQSWAIRVTGAAKEDIKPGWTISVTKKDGTLKEEVIERVISIINGVITCVPVPRDDQRERSHAKTDREDF